MLSTIEKRVKKDIRLNNLFKKGEKVLVIDDNTKESFLTLYLLKKITKGLDLKIDVKKDVGDSEKYDKILLPADADDVAEEFMLKITQNKEKKKVPKTILFLKSVLDSEVAECAKELGYECKNEKDESYLLDKIEAKYPGSKFGFLKSVKMLDGLE